MSRKITTGRVGRAVLGNLTTVNNSLQSVVANANVLLEPNGTGVTVSISDLQINTQNSLRLADADSSNYVALRAPTVVGNNITYTFPGSIAASNSVLLTDANGDLTWVAPFVSVANQTADSGTYYPTFTTASSGTVSTVNTSTTKLSFQPSTGTLTTTALVESSSIQLKENITPIENALESILMLTGVVYDRKDGSTKNEAGLIAEEVNKILPNLVTKDIHGDPYGINYTKFSAYLIEAVKTLKQQIDSLNKTKGE